MLAAAVALYMFFFSASLYFIKFHTEPSLEAIIVKLLPIVSLMGFVLFHSLGKGKVTRFAVGLLVGLFFSCVGDYYLIYRETRFVDAVASFAVAQLIYAITFGLKPWRFDVLRICILSGSAMFYYLYPGIQGHLVPTIALYVVLIKFMVWRAVARCQFADGKWTLGQLSCAIGAIFFVISDFIIGIDKFRFHIPDRQFYAVLTYFIAQFGITMSVTDYP